MEFPARLHVLLAQRSPQAVILRRGPSRQVAAIGWDRSSDTFTVGQWLKGAIYPYRSDISPDGRHWIYFAKSARRYQTWTAVANTPYLKALDFYPKEDAWNGGGLFVSNRSYWLNEGCAFPHGAGRRTSGLTLSPQWNNLPNLQGECPGIYFLRLARDGWSEGETAQTGQYGHTTRFYKRVNAHWQLCKLFHADLEHPPGKGVYHEEHLLRHAKSGEELPLPGDGWAELDKNRLLWAEEGKLMAGRVGREGLQSPKMLLDTNPLRFTQLEAPY